MDQRRNFVAVGLLTERDLEMLGSGFRAAFPLPEDSDFKELLARIDRAQQSGNSPTPPQK